MDSGPRKKSLGPGPDPDPRKIKPADPGPGMGMPQLPNGGGRISFGHSQPFGMGANEIFSPW